MDTFITSFVSLIFTVNTRNEEIYTYILKKKTRNAGNTKDYHGPKYANGFHPSDKSLFYFHAMDMKIVNSPNFSPT